MRALIERLVKIKDLIHSAEQTYGRDEGSVKLLAVSKSQPISAIKTLIDAGQYEFGENYVQEALPKMQILSDQRIIWHFIGRIQSNKIPAIATHFSWVHSLDSLKHAEKLAEYRPISAEPLNMCIQVNLEQESQKRGVAASQVFEFAKHLLNYPTLRLRGLMILPAVHENVEDQRRVFHQLFVMYQQLQQQGIPLDTLSMGMSHDFEAAIAEGATIVRIGTAVFGMRE